MPVLCSALSSIGPYNGLGETRRTEKRPTEQQRGGSTGDVSDHMALNPPMLYQLFGPV